MKKRFWIDNFEQTPRDPIMQENIEFLEDRRPEKVNAGIGMIMDERRGRVFVPAVVVRVGKKLAFENVGYLESAGHTGYLESHARELVFGPELWSQIQRKKGEKPETLVWAQTIGGTNALKWAATLLELGLLQGHKKLLLDPGWPNHLNIFRKFKIISYIHEDSATRAYRHTEYMKKLKNHLRECPVLLQVAGYNDDGTERTFAQWDEIVEVIYSKKLQPILDFAYNGLVNGWYEDNYLVKRLTKKGAVTIICVSNSKNVGYNLRLGSLYIVNLSPMAATKIQATLANSLIRPDYSNPVAIGAETLSTILNDKILLLEYKNEIDKVRLEILEHNRRKMVEALGRNFAWILKKKGLFFKLIPGGFSSQQVRFLKNEKAIHGPQSSRLNIGGLPSSRISEIARVYKLALSM